MARDNERILLVDDSRDTLEVLRRNLEPHGFMVKTASSVSEAVELLKRSSFDLVITDLKMPELSGLDLIRFVTDNIKDTYVLMITGYPSVDTAVSALKSGAQEYLSKPFTEDELLTVVRRVASALRARRTMESPSRAKGPFAGLLGESPAMRAMFEVMQRAAETTANVLIRGESGTHKESVARAIHYRGDRSDSPFIAVNCSAIPRELHDVEVFGRPSPTDRGPERRGLLDAAHTGTVFLDDVTEMVPEVQSRLASVLQEGRAQRGKLDVRVMAATNKDIALLVREGVFREALYYQLAVIDIEVPPLRARGDDVLLHLRQLSIRFAKQFGKEVPQFSDRALRLLQAHPWPGNLRELTTTAQRLVALNRGEEIDAPDLPSLMRYTALREMGDAKSLEAVEAEHIRRVLNSVGGNQSRAADILGIDRKTLRMKIRRMNDAGAG